MENQIYKEKFRIRSFDIDQDQHATIPAIIQIMQEASLQHTLELKVSYWDLLDHQASWVLLRKDIQFFKPASLNDLIEVVTCPSDFDRFFAFRDYICTDGNNEVIATATSAWTLMDLNTRKIRPMLTHFFKIPCISLLDGEACNFKLKKEEGMEYLRTCQVSVFDLDWNNHLNNSNLIKFMLSAIPDKKLNKVQLRFIAEASLEDIILISQKIKDDKILLEAYNETRQKTIALALAYQTS